MKNTFEVDQPQVPWPRTGAEPDPEHDTVAAHEKAAMLAEFNGTYDLAKWHRDCADRLRRKSGDASG